MRFFDKYLKAREEKRSILCVGLDPAPPGMRPLPKRYAGKDAIEGMLAYCIDIVEKTGASCCATKANLQFVFPFSLRQFQKLNAAIHEQGLLSILDIKLSDIGSSNAASVYWIKEAGFDALTFSPFAGNVREGVELAHQKELGIFVLTLMSNPEAKYFMKGEVAGIPAYRWIAREVREAGGDGVVVGATQAGRELEEIADIVGDGMIFLVPGVGAQGGNEEAVIKAVGKNLLINVGRSILNAEDPAQAAREFNERFNRLIGK
ncbi:MAG: orotidine-5'-phosphate decarboxylase [Candidatus Micrarchaeia archaeon]